MQCVPLMAGFGLSISILEVLVYASSLIHLVFFYFLPEKYSRLCVYRRPLPHSRLEGHLGAFHSGALTVKTALHICRQFFPCKNKSSFLWVWDKCPSTSVGSYEKSIFSLRTNCQIVPKETSPFYSPTSTVEELTSSTPYRHIFSSVPLNSAQWCLIVF